MRLGFHLFEKKRNDFFKIKKRFLLVRNTGKWYLCDEGKEAKIQLKLKKIPNKKEKDDGAFGF